MKRLLQLGFVVIVTLIGNAILISILHIETDPYYVMMLFVIVASSVGLYDYSKKT